MTGTTKAPVPRRGIAGKIVLTLSPFVLLVVLGLILGWLS